MDKWTQIEPLLVKSSIQAALECWGCPECIRVDNGLPWGTNSDVPSALALWLVGLGIEVIYGRPRQSTDNALVERCHGVLAHWVEPEKQADFKSFQERLNWAAWTQRERYRSAHHRTRAEVYPELFENLCSYRRQQEREIWDIKRVAFFLSQYRFKRKVEKNGRFNLMANTYSVGRQYARQELSIRLKASTQEWIVEDDYGCTIACFDSKELDYEKISQLQLGKRHKQ